MSASTDVESQSRSRGRRLDAFLIGSVIALFLMFAGALAGALWFAKHIENELNERKTRESESEASTGPRNMHLSDTGDAYKVRIYLAKMTLSVFRACFKVTKLKNDITGMFTIILFEEDSLYNTLQ